MNCSSKIASQINMLEKPNVTCATYLRDRSHLLSVFPEEVWQIILDKVSNTDSLEMLTNSSTFIRELLFPTRVEFLFNSVYKIMVNRGYLEDPYPDLLYLGPSLDELLVLRLVCQSWTKAIDTFYQHHADHFCLDQRTPRSRMNVVVHRSRTRVEIEIGGIPRIGYSSMLRNSSHPAMNSLDFFHYLFDSRYLDTGRNPFFGRSVSVRLSDHPGQTSLDYVEKSLKILSNYGHHIWYCRLLISNWFFPARECYSRIRATLQQLPNLKMLHVEAEKHGCTWDATDLAPEVEQWPLPTLEKLEMLSIDSTLPPILYELLRRNSHISTLAVLHNNIHADYDIFCVALPNLKTLFVKFYLPESNLDKINSVDVDWPRVTELHLHLNSSVTSPEWEEIFDALQKKFKKSLVKLNLTLPGRVGKSTEMLLNESYKLDLPKVTHLELNMTSLECLDFVQPMRDSLQVLHINVNPRRSQSVDDMIQKVEAGHVHPDELFNLYNYKTGQLTRWMWTFFTKLKEFHIEFHSDAKRLIPHINLCSDIVGQTIERNGSKKVKNNC